MTEPPTVISRPDPYLTPRESYRDMAYCMATRGETILWIASLDSDGRPSALVVVPPQEITVEENPRNRLFPIYTWGTEKDTRYSPANPTGRFVHITYLKEPGELRGKGPLQLCGAAISVAVEAANWAANFYADTGYPSIVIKSAEEIDELEATGLKTQWMKSPNNVPRVIDPGIESVEDFGVNEQGAQMLDARNYQNGDAARMFGIPGALLEYQTSGSSLTYQNRTEVWTDFVRGSLSPNYLEPIEQGITDLLPRSTTCRFNVKGFLRADIKTRYEVYGIGIDKGIITPDIAQQEEGYQPGDVEFAPVPFAPPAAIPASLPFQRSEPEEFRCSGMAIKRRSGVARLETCGRLLARSASFTGTCPRCKKGYPEAA